MKHLSQHSLDVWHLHLPFQTPHSPTHRGSSQVPTPHLLIHLHAQSLLHRQSHIPHQATLFSQPIVQRLARNNKQCGVHSLGIDSLYCPHSSPPTIEARHNSAERTRPLTLRLAHSKTTRPPSHVDASSLIKHTYPPPPPQHRARAARSLFTHYTPIVERSATMRSQATLTALALVSSVSAFWRMPCRSQTGVGRLDPIMDPGEISDHVHTFSGGGGMHALVEMSLKMALILVQDLASTRTMAPSMPRALAPLAKSRKIIPRTGLRPCIFCIPTAPR